MNDCLGKYGSHPEYCYKCLVSESCLVQTKKIELEVLIKLIYAETLDRYGGEFTHDQDPPEHIWDITETLVNLLDYARDSDAFSVNDEVAVAVAVHILRDLE